MRNVGTVPGPSGPGTSDAGASRSDPYEADPSGWAASGGPGSVGIMRTLIVEDDPEINALLAETLEGLGYAVDRCGRGDDALGLLDHFPYDLVLLDLMLPARDGLDVLRTVRSRGLTTPVLVLTARDGVRDRVDGLERGADDYLVKPFHLQELRARVRALVRRSTGAAQNLVSVGRLEMDLERRTVHWDGHGVRLAGREYALLEFLALHADGYYPRETLLEHAWPADASIDPRTVDTYIRYLRRKLDDSAIDTARGLGYRFKG